MSPFLLSHFDTEGPFGLPMKDAQAIALEKRLRFCGIQLGRHQCDFTGDAIYLSLAPPFLGCFDCVDRFAHAGPSVIELAKLGKRNRQI